VNDLLTICTKTKQVKALSLDEPLDTLWSGGFVTLRVLDVYDHAMNLLYENEAMIVLLPGNRLNGPYRIIVDVPPSFSFREWGLHPGDTFMACEGRLCNFSRNVAIAREGASIWSPSQEKSRLSSPSSSLPDRIFQASRFLMPHLRSEERPFFSFLLGQNASEEGDETGLYGRLMKVFTPMRRGVLFGDSHLIKQSAEGALGLGRGLTPTADDILLGFINALHYSLPMARLFLEASREILSWFRSFIAREAHRTTPVSQWSLGMAGEGRISEEALRFCRLIAGEAAGEFREGGRFLLSIGDSSGREIALGILVGMSFALGDYCQKGRDEAW
jgi:hypothetical protein